MKIDHFFRSMRLRLAIFVGLATAIIAGYFAEFHADRSLELKSKQTFFELRAATYDVLLYLRQHGVISTGAQARATLRLADLSDPSAVFSLDKHDARIGWALYDHNGEYSMGTEQPPTSYAEASRLLRSVGTAPATVPPTWPQTTAIEVETVDPGGQYPRWTLARTHLPEGQLILWFDMAFVDYRFGDRWLWRSSRIILLYGLAAATITWLILNFSLAPVRRIAKHTQEISEHSLSERIQPRREPVEFDAMIHVLNDMLDRLESSFQRVAGFSADASHELKTPIAILQGELELALKQAPDNSAEQQRYLELLEEVYRLNDIVETLLLLAHSDRGKLVSRWQPLDLRDTVNEVAEIIQQLDADLAVSTCTPLPAIVLGDPSLLHQLVLNLGTNAVRYNRAGGSIKLDLNANGTRVYLDVENSGAPIPEDQAGRIFDRFHRVDPARSRNTGGHGLGLNLVSEIARAHHGWVMLRHNENDRISFRVELPCLRNGSPVPPPA